MGAFPGSVATCSRKQASLASQSLPVRALNSVPPPQPNSVSGHVPQPNTSKAPDSPLALFSPPAVSLWLLGQPSSRPPSLCTSPCPASSRLQASPDARLLVNPVSLPFRHHRTLPAFTIHLVLVWFGVRGATSIGIQKIIQALCSDPWRGRGTMGSARDGAGVSTVRPALIVSEERPVLPARTLSVPTCTNRHGTTLP